MAGKPRPHVVYWNHSPTPYFVERFNAVAERGVIDFEAWFNDRREPSRSWDVDESGWGFRARYIPRRRLLGWSERVPIAELAEWRPDLLVQEYDRSHLVAGFLAAAAGPGRTAFRVLPNYDSWSERTWWRELGKRVVFGAVDGAKVPGPGGRELAMHYGLPAERIAEVTQSVDVARLAHDSALPAEERRGRRQELGLDGCVFIYVGRLWSGKGMDDLFDAYEGLLSQGRDVSLLLLGDGPDERVYRARAAGLRRVAFAGFVQSSEIARFYGLADAMVFPTLGDPHGLVVEEAMACGLPVIASEAAGDVKARLGDGGLLAPPRAGGVLEARMLELADDPARRLEMGERAGALARTRDHQRYAEDFERFVEHLLACPPRTGGYARAARIAGRVLARAGAARDPAPLIE